MLIEIYFDGGHDHNSKGYFESDRFNFVTCDEYPHFVFKCDGDSWSEEDFTNISTIKVNGDIIWTNTIYQVK
jgi:hypothetical protein